MGGIKRKQKQECKGANCSAPRGSQPKKQRKTKPPKRGSGGGSSKKTNTSTPKSTPSHQNPRFMGGTSSPSTTALQRAEADGLKNRDKIYSKGGRINKIKHRRK